MHRREAARRSTHANRTAILVSGGIFAMSRIPMVEPENASPEVRALYDEIQRAGMPVFNVMKMFANNSNCLAALVNFMHGIYSQNAKLTPRLRELAYLRSSQLNSCHY
jgi:alkylhydroperoxidase family enzyme